MRQTKQSACQLAINHFDMHYSPVYDSQWPSVRAALLSKPKHCALVNNFAADRKQIDISLAELGAHDFLWKAREKFVRKQSEDVHRDTHRKSADEVGALLFCNFLFVFFIKEFFSFVVLMNSAE